MCISPTTHLLARYWRTIPTLRHRGRWQEPSANANQFEYRLSPTACRKTCQASSVVDSRRNDHDDAGELRRRRALAPPGVIAILLPVQVSNATPSANPARPTIDAAGHDLERLPRFPEVTRVHYERSIELDLTTTSIEYMTSATLGEVHGFYRVAFQNHDWIVCDLDFSANERYVFFVSGTQEARVTVLDRDSHVAVMIALSEWFHTEAAIDAPAPPQPPRKGPFTPTSQPIER